MQYIFHIIKNYRRQFIFMSIISAISGCSVALFLVLINYSVTISGQANSYLIYAFVGIIIIVLGSQYTHKLYFSKVSSEIIKQLRFDLSKKILASPLRFKEQCGDAELLTLLTQDIQALSLFFNNLPLLLSSVILIITVLIYICFISGLVMGLLLLSFLGAGILIMVFSMSKVKSLFEQLRQHEASLLSHFRDLVMGFKELKMNTEHDLADEFIAPETSNIKLLTIVTEVKQAVAMNWAYGSIYVLITMLIFIYPLWNSLSSEEVLSNVLTIIFLITPIQTASMTLPLLIRANVAAKRITDVESELESNTELLKPNSLVTNVLFESIVLVELCFSYTDKNKIQLGDNNRLGPYNLSILNQDIIFFTGGNGSGKSTLIKLLSGLYKPQSGHIYWNSKTLEDCQLVDYRSQFSSVFSDFHLYNAVDLYQLYSLLESSIAKKWGGQTLLEEFGLDKVIVIGKPISVEALSSGQKKRLAILIAILQPKPICLFDEPAAELDPSFKHYFYTELIHKLRGCGKTIIVVTHDNNYFDQADSVLQLRDGEVI